MLTVGVVEKNFVTEHGISAPEGRQFKALMILRGLRVADVAKAAGMGRPTLYRVLAGTRALSEDERARLLGALGAAQGRIPSPAVHGGPRSDGMPEDATPSNDVCAGDEAK